MLTSAQYIFIPLTAITAVYVARWNDLAASVADQQTGFTWAPSSLSGGCGTSTASRPTAVGVNPS